MRGVSHAQGDGRRASVMFKMMGGASVMFKVMGGGEGRQQCSR